MTVYDCVDIRDLTLVVSLGSHGEFFRIGKGALSIVIYLSSIDVDAAADASSGIVVKPPGDGSCSGH